MFYSIVIIICVICLIMLRYLNEEYNTKDGEFMFGLVIGAFFVISFCFFIYGLNGCFLPSAKDVVDGKTTLKITYTDSIPTDTTIVYKDGYGGVKWW